MSLFIPLYHTQVQKKPTESPLCGRKENQYWKRMSGLRTLRLCPRSEGAGLASQETAG